MVIFHYVHHHINRKRHLKNLSIPLIPEEKNPVYYAYPICILISIVFAMFWLFTRILIKRPQIAFAGCVVGAMLLLIAGIIEMKHADVYLDLANISDEELIVNPIFLHNFILCLMSIFGMTIYLLQSWILMDYWQQIKKYGHIRNVFIDNRDSDYSDTIEHYQLQKIMRKSKDKGKEEPGELDPIPALSKFPSLTSISEPNSISEEPVILYCCFFDWYKYIRHECLKQRAMHEFQVVHVM